MLDRILSLPVSIRWIVTLSLVIAVIVLSVIPGYARAGDSAFIWLVAATPSPVQKLMHFLVYAALGWMWAWTLEGIAPRWLRLLTAFALAVGLGVALEWYQTRVPGRFGTLLDVVLNAFGVIVGLIAALLIL